MSDFVQDLLGKAVTIGPKKKKVGYIVDRDPMDNSLLIFFSEEQMLWSKPEKLTFRPEKDLTVEIIDVNGDLPNAKPNIEKIGKTLVIHRLTYSDASDSVQHSLSNKIEFAAEEQKVGDMVNHPAHYTFGKFEVLDVLEDWNLGFHESNVIKYLARAGKKDPKTTLQDYYKALTYLQRKIKMLEKE